MLSLNKLRLVFLMCGFFSFCDPVEIIGSEQRSNATGCESCSHFCCEGKIYNPRSNTCCKTKGNPTDNLNVGLSERMSQCCGETAYNPLNEICCKLKVKPKPSHDAICCGEEPYDESKKICCTENLLERLSPHHKCCYGKLFDSSIENCCQGMFPRIQMKFNNDKVCVKNFRCDPTLPGERQCNCSVGNHVNEAEESDKKNASSTQKQVCKTRDENEVYDKKKDFLCCGLYYFNTTLWSCKDGKLQAKTKK